MDDNEMREIANIAYKLLDAWYNLTYGDAKDPDYIERRYLEIHNRIYEITGVQQTQPNDLF